VLRNLVAGGSDAVVILVVGLIGLVALCVVIFGVLLVIAWRKRSASRRTKMFILP